MRMTVCNEIRTHYAAWRFLAMMDCSNQSLNQVRIFFFLCFYSTLSFISNYLYLFIFVGMLQGHLFSAEEFPKMG